MTAPLSIRERILRNLRTWLESIRSLGPAIAAETNADGVTYASGGTYSGLVTRCYRVAVSTGGASGEAAVTVTDETPAEQMALWPLMSPGESQTTDDGPSDYVVTSGEAIPLGGSDLGATLTLTFADELQVGDSWDVWVGPWQTDIGRVTRDEDRPEPDDAWIVQHVPQERSRPGPLSKETNLMRVPLEVFLQRSPDMPGDIEKALADVRACIRVDPTRGALAVDTTCEANDGIALQEAKAGGSFAADVLIHYRTADNDPRTL